MRNCLAGIPLILTLLSGCHGISSVVQTSEHQDPHGNHRSQESPFKDVTSFHTSQPTKVIDLKALSELDAIIPHLAEKRVVFIGENHTRLADHENQLAIIRGLSERGKEITIGMEFFQQPFQPYLDDFIAGNMDDTDLLSHTKYYERWQYDYRLYQPILNFARKRKIPLIALNVSSEIVKKVSKEGWGALTENNMTTEELAQIPQTIDRSNKDYEKRLHEIFLQHADFAGNSPGTTWRRRLPHEGMTSRSRKGVTNFQRFMDVQLLWDEGMAERAAKYVTEYPTRTLIVLAGSGHLAYGDGIPDRLEKRVSVDTAIILPADGMEPDPDVADFLLVSEEKHLPRKGTLGVELETNAEGIQVASLLQESAAKAVGIKTHDRIRSVDKWPIRTIGDIKLALWNKQPGDRVSVEIYRTNWLRGGENMRFEVKLR
uniref:Uncharacterized iron-regulated protein n=1 Tax=Candidatus Kentrum sp. TUN TaxID=2126343 RepID=A0A451A6K7_9GAMM|nr:MAG: Uncharacterized iron-regulated protein [Candidatus Kentron sp. TUN]VFK55521.1 MAG: Uncharacterized iron-regulated protein [Candidatus Kentron sp. TUN]VFK61660.1 MAG: Uncharacterized iron-regulated protein [Candidatus Kentron sp. TUN]